MCWHKQLQNSQQSTFWKNWEFYTEGNSINDTEMLIRLEKNWRLKIFFYFFFLKLFPSTAWFWFSVHVMSSSNLYSYNQCSLTQRCIRILFCSRSYPKDLIPLLPLWSVPVSSLLLSSLPYRKMTYSFPFSWASSSNFTEIFPHESESNVFVQGLLDWHGLYLLCHGHLHAVRST